MVQGLGLGLLAERKNSKAQISRKRWIVRPISIEEQAGTNQY